MSKVFQFGERLPEYGVAVLNGLQIISVPQEWRDVILGIESNGLHSNGFSLVLSYDTEPHVFRRFGVIGDEEVHIDTEGLCDL